MSDKQKKIFRRLHEAQQLLLRREFPDEDDLSRLFSTYEQLKMFAQAASMYEHGEA